MNRTSKVLSLIEKYDLRVCSIAGKLSGFSVEELEFLLAFLQEEFEDLDIKNQELVVKMVGLDMKLGSRKFSESEAQDLKLRLDLLKCRYNYYKSERHNMALLMNVVKTEIISRQFD